MKDMVLGGAISFGRIVLPPVLQRVGTGFAVWLVAQGVPHDTVDQAVAAATLLAGLGFDLVVKAFLRGR